MNFMKKEYWNRHHVKKMFNTHYLVSISIVVYVSNVLYRELAQLKAFSVRFLLILFYYQWNFLGNKHVFIKGSRKTDSSQFKTKKSVRPLVPWTLPNKWCNPRETTSTNPPLTRLQTAESTNETFTRFTTASVNTSLQVTWPGVRLAQI